MKNISSETRLHCGCELFRCDMIFQPDRLSVHSKEQEPLLFWCVLVSPVLIVRNMYLCLLCAGVTGVDRKEHVPVPVVCGCHRC